MIMGKGTKTFELPTDVQPYGKFSPRKCYCYYCGERAKSKDRSVDIGDTDYIYYCDCEMATRENDIKGRIDDLERELILLKNSSLLRHLEKPSAIYSYMMCNAEIQMAKRKYGIGVDEDVTNKLEEHGYSTGSPNTGDGSES